MSELDTAVMRFTPDMQTYLTKVNAKLLWLALSNLAVLAQHHNLLGQNIHDKIVPELGYLERRDDIEREC